MREVLCHQTISGSDLILSLLELHTTPPFTSNYIRCYIVKGWCV